MGQQVVGLDGHEWGRGQLCWNGKNRDRTIAHHSTQPAQLGHSSGLHSQVYKLVSNRYCNTVSQSKSHCQALMEERKSRLHFVVASMSKVLCRGVCAGLGLWYFCSLPTLRVPLDSDCCGGYWGKKESTVEFICIHFRVLSVMPQRYRLYN